MLPLVEKLSFWLLLYTLLYIVLLSFYEEFGGLSIKTIKIKSIEAQFFDRNADRKLTGNICTEN